ncbi:MAG: RagB/SusD family nutrient uptake outer membrane protein [Chryseobacterium sp.]|nr:MAG: RagB/SusD family nutrient uptake outer membrane protein [Chryseobacterium sp.]
MKKYSLFASLLFLLLTCGSCKKYLDAKSNVKLVTPQTLKDLQGLLDDADLMNFKVTAGLMESETDDYFILPATYESMVTNYQNQYQWLIPDIRFPNDWSVGYKAIYNANLSLDLLGGIERNNENAASWDNVRGSALFYRAYHLLSLVTQYAKVYDEKSASSDKGVVIRIGSDFNIPSVRASVRESYQEVIDDANESIGLLPLYSQNTLRPSKGAVYALLARTYLYMGKYADALNYSDQALKINSTLMDFNGDPNISSLTASLPFKRFNSETVFYSEISLSSIIHSPTRARIDTLLTASYNAADLRKTGFFTTIAGYQQFKGNYSASSATYFSGLATDELYLIRAESNAYLGNLDAALMDANLLLKKRWDRTKTFVPLTGSSKAEVLSKIRLERRKELIFRGVRWIDIKRYNREGENITPKRNIRGNIVSLLPNSPIYALPLPIDIVVQGILQN